MSLTKTDEVLFLLLRRALGQKTEIGVSFDAADWVALYRMAGEHDLSHMLGPVAGELLASASEEIRFKLRKKHLLSVSRYAQQQYEYERILSLFEENAIAHLPLKGAVLRELYPDPAMRTSCDVDILIKSEELARAKALLLDSLGYKEGETGTHDVAFHGTSDVRLELHFTLNEPDFTVSPVLSEIWDRLIPEEGCRYRYRMTNEQFVFYHLYHMAKHFAAGGCGIRPFMDLWVMKGHMAYDEDTVSGYLDAVGLCLFSYSADALCEVWFGGASHTPITERMEAYLLDAGAYGTRENLMAIRQNKNGGKFGYLMKRMFPSSSALAHAYPVLKKHRLLYPICLLRRWFGFLFCKNKSRVISELSETAAVKGEHRDSLAALFSELQLP